MGTPGIDACSCVPLYVEAYFGDLKLGSATAFLWLRRDLKLSLVTNWHVAAGRNHETGKCIDPMATVPDHLHVHVPLCERAKPPLIVRVPTIDDEGEAMWIEHPDHHRSVDVVALDIDLPPPGQVDTMPMNAIRTVAIKQRVGMPIFILGYPFGRTGIGMPVWKQASFASEPFLAPDRDHRFLIVDTASRPGMSGSPVIQRVHGTVEFEGNRHGRIEGGDGACSFVGVYSGRFHTDDPNDAQLGRVWPARLIEEIIAHRVRLGDR